MIWQYTNIVSYVQYIIDVFTCTGICSRKHETQDQSMREQLGKGIRYVKENYTSSTSMATILTWFAGLGLGPSCWTAL